MAKQLSQIEIDEWLQKNVPHRIRVMLTSTPKLSGLRPHSDPNFPDSVVRRCWTDAVWEGRLSALRWLCEFVDIKMGTNGKPAPVGGSRPERTYITDLPGGASMPIASNEATALADAWKACTQGSVHPTQSSGHPPIDDVKRNTALDIIVNHLDKTVYANEPDWMTKWVLEQPPS